MEASGTFDQTPGADPLLEEELAYLTLISMRLNTVEQLSESPRMLPEIIKLRQDVDKRIAIKRADLLRIRTPED